MIRFRMIRVCFVCLGNICRSPTAEAIFTKLVEDAGLSDQFVIDSAGTSGWHEGSRADSRSREAASRRGIDITSRSRQFLPTDFDRFDYVIAMDADNRANLEALASSDAERDKIHVMRQYNSPPAPHLEVPDPYYGGATGFEDVLDICEDASRGLLRYLSDVHSL